MELVICDDGTKAYGVLSLLAHFHTTIVVVSGMELGGIAFLVLRKSGYDCTDVATENLAFKVMEQFLE